MAGILNGIYHDVVGVIHINKPTHVMIGEVLLEFARERFGLILRRDAFLLGCVLPDYGIQFITKPHIQKNYDLYVKKRIEQLLNAEPDPALAGSAYSRRIGIICHFYADFFCCPHSRNMYCGVSNHVKYERELWHFMQEYLNSFRINKYKSNTTIHQITDWKKLNSEFIFSRFEAFHSEYLKEEPSFETDLRYTIDASAEMLEMTLYASARTANEQNPILMSVLQGI